jgi:putative endonuclease
MRALGPRGEDMAVKLLKRKGYRILERNFKGPSGEIDIIARDGGTLVFVEVKTRTDGLFGHPFEAVHSRKRHKMKTTALHYLSQQKEEEPARFDIVSISMKAGGKEIEHIKDAFGVTDPC